MGQANLFKTRWAGLFIAAMVFAAAAPTLRWQEFSSGSENLNVATALEMRRTGHWMLPTLQGLPRVAKPPLTAWITASMLRESTLQRLSDPNAAVRAEAYRELYWQVRWPALLIACLTVVAVFELARIVGGMQLAVLSALVVGTNYAFLRFSRAATTDVQLALWVVVANVFLAKALVERKYWIGYVGAGVAIGLAFMSKGPVAIVCTILPAAAFAGWRHYSLSLRERAGVRASEQTNSPDLLTPPHPDPLPKGEGRQLPAILAGLALMLLVSVPWFVAVIREHGEGIWDLWFREVTREGATNLEPSKWYAYFSVFPMLLPWIVFFIAGLIVYVVELRPGKRNPNALLPLFMLVVPILVMTCFRDKKERYLLPMIGPAAIVAARGLIVWLSEKGRDEIVRKLRPTLVGIHYALLVVAGVVFSVAAALGVVEDLRRADGSPWLPMGMGISAAVVAALILALSLIAQKRRPMALVGATVGVMLMVQGLFAFGYSHSESGRSEMRPLAEAIWARYPTAAMASYRPGRRAPEDLSIYLNRTVHPVEDVRALEQAEGVVVMYQRQGEALPQPPGEWTRFATAQRGKNFWHAYARTARKP